MTKNETEEVEEVEADEADTDTTDWKAETLKLRAKASAQRETTKELKAKLAEFENKPPEKKSDFGLLEKAYLRSAGITSEDEVELIKKWQKDTGKGYDELVEHPFVSAELNKLRQAKANQIATSNVKGEGKETDKNSVDYWLARGELPENIPANRKLLADIGRAMMKKSKSGTKFYNE